MAFIEAFKSPWEDVIKPFERALNGEHQDVGINELWKTYDNPGEMDLWAGDWATGLQRAQAEKDAPQASQGADLAQVVTGAKNVEPKDAKPAGPAGPAVGGPGHFSVAAWENTVENGRIPMHALARVEGTNYMMNPYAASALAAMIQAARADGVGLSIGNTYRDWALQAQLFRDYQNGSHPAPVAAPGTSEHGWGLAVDLESIEYGGQQSNWLKQNAARFGFSNPFSDPSTEPWHWEYGQGDGPPDFTDRPVTGRGAGVIDPMKKPKTASAEPNNPALAPLLLSEGPAAFSTVMAELFIPGYTKSLPQGSGAPSAQTFKGKNGSVERQLAAGFMDAGRPDLAKLVGTKDFTQWIAAESGWNVGSVSQYYPGHGRNYGLFQFAQIHDWTSKYLDNGQWTASPYEQAGLVAQYFHLTPGDVANYAQQIRNGTYSGWG